MRHAKEENNSGDSFGLRATLVWCGIPIIIVLLIRIFLLGFYVIPSGSMMNTIEPGDRVITSKLTPKVFDLKRGDVVVFKDPDHWLRQEDSSKLGGDYLIKRLIGLPGDTVACEGPGKPITINGVAIDESRRGSQLIRVQRDRDRRTRVRYGRQSRQFRRFTLSSG